MRQRLITILLAMSLGAVAADEKRTVLICQASNPATAIAHTAVAELKLHLERFFPMTVTVANGVEACPEGGLRFVVGAGPEDSATVDSDGRFAIAIRGDTIWLWGHDRQAGRDATWDPRNSRKGTLQAVYQFLSEFGGVRWLMPGDENTVRLNPAAPLTLSATFDKVYDWRFSRLHMDMYGPDRGVGNFLWRNMGRINFGESDSYQHFWGPLIGYNRYVKDHPEYYALVNGERQSFPAGDHPATQRVQLCTSNPAVVEIVAHSIITRFRATHQEIIPISPNDGGGFCECANCRALDRPELYAADEIADLGGQCLSDRVFTFANAVARLVKAEEPEARLGIHLYSYYAEPPRSIERLEDNIIGEFCVEPAYFNDAAYRQQTMDRLKKWQSKGLGGIGFYWYEGCYYWSQTLHVCPHAIAELLQVAAAQPGTLGVKTEANYDFATNALNYYVMFSITNDPSRDVDEVIDEFCRLAFGPGSAPMKEYFALAETTFMARDSKAWKHYAEVVRWYDDDFFAQAYALIGKAMRLTSAADPGCQERLRLMLDALSHTHNTVAFLQSAAALRQFGVPFYLPHLSSAYRPPFPIRPGDFKMRDALIDRTTQAYERWRAFALSHDNTPYFQPSEMLTLDPIGHWGETCDMLSALRGKRELIVFNARYPFHTDEAGQGEALGWHTPEFEPVDWLSLRLDAWWEDQGIASLAAPEPDGYNGFAWYRLPFTVPDKSRGMKAELHLGAVDESCWIWVNGTQVGSFPFDAVNEPDGWNIPRVVDISGVVRHDGPNLIAVRVEDSSGKGGIWKGAFITFEETP